MGYREWESRNMIPGERVRGETGDCTRKDRKSAIAWK